MKECRRSGWLVIAVCVWTLAVLPGWAAPPETVKNAVVKIYTIHNRPDYYNPWSMRSTMPSTGSGAVIEGRRILSNAHVVSDQTFVQVRRSGEAKRWQAKVLSVAHAADLALLTVEDPAFFEGITPLELGDLPQLQQEVLVYGFPLGGDTLSITRGVVSRIEHQRYSHSSCNLLAGQIDAAINPGNSGGPAILDGKIAGVVMQGMQSADNIGYMVPTPVIRHFLEDIEDGRYDGWPSIGVALQNMENPDLKRSVKMPEGRTGVMIVGVVRGSAADGVLKPGDILLSIDGTNVADDGTVEFRPQERTSISYVLQQHQLGETATIEFLREGAVQEGELKLNRPMESDWLIPATQYDRLPTYYIYGGFVFCPLSVNLLQAWGPNWYNTAPNELTSRLSFNFLTDETNEIVLLLRVLPSDINQGYHTTANWVIDRVNGKPIRDLKDLIRIVEQESEGPFVSFENRFGYRLILDKKKAIETGPEILSTYRIPADRSPDLKVESATPAPTTD